MKRLLPLLLLATLGCKAQSLELLEPVIVDVPLEVIAITDKNMVLQSKLTNFRVNVDPKDLEVEKVYWFWISLAPCNSCKTQTGIVLDYSISPDQANRDIKAKDKKIREQSLK